MSTTPTSNPRTNTTRQTAANEAADTSNPHAIGAGTTMPVGTSNEPSNESNGGKDREGGRSVEEEGGKGEWASGDAAPSSNDDGGDESVRHTYVVPNTTQPPPYYALPTLHERGPPPSVSLEGEMTGQRSSGHVDETATHPGTPRDETTTTHLIRMPHDKESSGEGRRMAMGHRESVGEEIEVEGGEDERNASYGDDERRRRREKARDEATGDEEGLENRKEGREVEETTDEGEEGRTSVQARATTDTVSTRQTDGLTSNTPRTTTSPNTITSTSPNTSTSSSNTTILQTTTRSRTKRPHEPVQTPCTTQAATREHTDANPRA
jgi:hypothetical protein